MEEARNWGGGGLNTNPQFLNIVKTFYVDGMKKEIERTDGHLNSVAKHTC
jgi:hypothetical protein